MNTKTIFFINFFLLWVLIIYSIFSRHSTTNALIIIYAVFTVLIFCLNMANDYIGVLRAQNKKNDTEPVEALKSRLDRLETLLNVQRNMKQ